MPDNDPKWAAQKRCDNNRKDVKAERRKITNWVKDAEKELKTGLPISGRRKGRELKLQRRIAEQARQHPVDCLAAAREFLRQFKAEYDAPTPQPSDPISSGEGTPRERDEISVGRLGFSIIRLQKCANYSQPLAQLCGTANA